MKLSLKQLEAIREKLNRANFLLEAGQNAQAAQLLEDLADAIDLAGRRSEMKQVTTAPHDSGAWQEAGQ